jgi:HEAT repeat protein
MTTHEKAQHDQKAADKAEHIHNVEAVAPPAAPDIEHIMQFFTVEGVAEPLRNVAKLFNDTAAATFALPRSPEQLNSLRKLLESRDAALRAAVAK